MIQDLFSVTRILLIDVDNLVYFFSTVFKLSPLLLLYTSTYISSVGIHTIFLLNRPQAEFNNCDCYILRSSQVRTRRFHFDADRLSSLWYLQFPHTYTKDARTFRMAEMITMREFIYTRMVINEGLFQYQTTTIIIKIIEFIADLENVISTRAKKRVEHYGLANLMYCIPLRRNSLWTLNDVSLTRFQNFNENIEGAKYLI